MTEEFFTEADIISTYTDAEAIEDGVLFDSTSWNLRVSNLPINRITDTVYRRLEKATINTDWTPRDLAASLLKRLLPEAEYSERMITMQSSENEDTRFWLVPNEVKGCTLMHPSDY